MRKLVKRKMPKTQIVAIPDAENAKWLAFGFLASVVFVGILCLIILSSRAN